MPTMAIADPVCHRTLAYVASIQAQGYTPTVSQVREYGKRTRRRSRDADRLLLAAWENCENAEESGGGQGKAKGPNAPQT